MVCCTGIATGRGMQLVVIATWMDVAATGNCNCNYELLELELEDA